MLIQHLVSHKKPLLPLLVPVLVVPTIDTITLPGLEMEVAVTDIRVLRDVICQATVMLFSST